MTDEAPLAQAYDVAMLDLDGVVYSGADAVPYAAQVLEQATRLGMRLAFVTNNASRTPEVVRDHLRAVGVPAETDQIITSAQVAARVLADRLAPGARVLVVGDVGLRQEVELTGLTVVAAGGADVDPPVEAVVQGHSTTTGWPQLAEATVAVRGGALWVAANLDLSIPSPRGALPGNGSMVGVVEAALGRSPDAVAGKPDPTMHAETVRRTGAERPLVVGDRLDTDIEGANRVGVNSLLVLTGVTAAADLLGAPPEHRPTYLGRDLRTILAPGRVPAPDGDGFVLGRWRAWVEDTDVHASSLGMAAGEPTDDAMDLLRVVCAAGWAGGGTTFSGTDPDATQLLGELGIAVG